MNCSLYINVDGDKIARVFDNLLKNAVNYSYPNSEIAINADRTERGISIRFRNKGDRIPPEQLDNIFEKFYRLDTSRSSKTGGAGLGLAIAKEIVELHGGTISAASSSEYTEFQVFLPG
jgi:two-component system sensor histidine kinase VanS